MTLLKKAKRATETKGVRTLLQTEISEVSGGLNPQPLPPSPPTPPNERKLTRS
jgi:hypothetical protein